MKPDLDLDGRPAGPQMLAGWSGVRSTGPFDPGSTNPAYAGPPPAYVTGTDYAQTAYAGPPPAEVPRRMAREEEPRPEPSVITRAAYEEPPAEPVLYPSISGGQDGADQPPAPPADPEAATVTG